MNDIKTAIPFPEDGFSPFVYDDETSSPWVRSHGTGSSICQWPSVKGFRSGDFLLTHSSVLLLVILRLDTGIRQPLPRLVVGFTSYGQVLGSPHQYHTGRFIQTHHPFLRANGRRMGLTQNYLETFRIT